MSALWNKVESALVGGELDAWRVLGRALAEADTSEALLEAQRVGRELAGVHADLLRGRRDHVRHAVAHAREVWPNDGDEYAPRELLRRAFRLLRAHLAQGRTLDYALGELETEAARYEDM